MNTVIIASTQVRFADLLRTLLQFESDITVVDITHNSEELLDAVSVHAPDVVLLHTDVPNYERLIGSVMHLSPHTQVCMLGDRSPDIMRTCMREGARDFLDLEAVLG